MHYDVLVIGGGLSGLTSAALLAKRGVRVAVAEKSQNPGGSCGIFRRSGVTFDQGSAMLFGFGEKGFNAHRFVMNCLGEPIHVLRHDYLYCVNFKGKRIKFWADPDKFADELSELFPTERQNIRRFYRDLGTLYQHVMVENPAYSTADETDRQTALRSILKHPLSYARFLSYLNRSAKSLLKKYFRDPEIFKFFDKLTSTYCYTTLEESPAVLAAVMFIDNHVGGSYYPAGSTLFLPGKLEKAIEENGGDMLLEHEVTRILFDNGRPSGAEFADGSTVTADSIVYSGTVWNLYGKLIDAKETTPDKIAWAARQVPTYPSVVLYAHVDASVIPPDTAPIEMLVGNPDSLDESEVTAYILSIDDKTLCGPSGHVVAAIGPSFQTWDAGDKADYQRKKAEERQRLIGVLEKRFPGFARAVRYAEVATPLTIERYNNKNGGAVAGPKQMLGQHMFNRLHTRTEWDNLFCCGESTVMGTGTPTVTTSGISAANAVLKKLGKQPFVHDPSMKNVVTVLDKPFTDIGCLYDAYPEDARRAMRGAMRCQFCEHPGCRVDPRSDIQGIMRRVAVGNLAGARKRAAQCPECYTPEALRESEAHCVLSKKAEGAVAIRDIVGFLLCEVPDGQDGI
jgi:prolycopene isomerase